MAELPAWVYGGATANTGVQATKTPVTAARAAVEEGGRNSALFQFACLLASSGLHVDEIAAALAARNEACCQPPLAGDEVQTIADSAARRPGVRVSDDDILDYDLQPHSAVKVYLALRAMANDQGVCIAGYDRLTKRARVSKSNASAGVKELERKKLIHVKRPPAPKVGELRLANVYTLLDVSSGTNGKDHH